MNETEDYAFCYILLLANLLANSSLVFCYSFRYIHCFTLPRQLAEMKPHNNKYTNEGFVIGHLARLLVTLLGNGIWQIKLNQTLSLFSDS